MYKNLKTIFNPIYLFFSKILNRSNINKVIFIFVIGLISRTFINYTYNINVFSDYLSKLSILYYLFFSLLIIIIHEFIDYYHVNIIPSFSFINLLYSTIINTISFIIKMLVSMNTRIFSYKLEDINISSIIKGIKYFNWDKATLEVNKPFIHSVNGNKSIKESYILEKNEKDGVKKSVGSSVNREEYNRLRREEADRLRESRREASRLRRVETNRLREERAEYGRRRELERGRGKGRSGARREEVRLRREQAERMAEERLRSGLITGGEINFDANTSSQIGSNRIREDARLYQSSLELPPILGFEYPSRSLPSWMEPPVNNNPPVMESPVNNNSSSNNNSSVMEPSPDYQNNSQGNNNYTENNKK